MGSNPTVPTTSMKDKYTEFEIAEYVTGWLSSHECWHDLTAIKAMLSNALHQLEDGEDGIAATFQRRSERRVK